jgi:hypothetical protein
MVAAWLVALVALSGNSLVHISCTCAGVLCRLGLLLIACVLCVGSSFAAGCVLYFRYVALSPPVDVPARFSSM